MLFCKFNKYFFAFGVIVLAVLLSSFDSRANDRGFIDVDFDYSMGIKNPKEYHIYFQRPYSKERMDFFRNLYNKNKPSKKKYSLDPYIPKIIHQIWIGGSIPPIYHYYQKTCKDLHPDWDYRLWTEREIDALNFENRDLYDDTKSLAEKSDILRYQILKDYGGVYIDMDTRCIKPFDDLNHLYEAYFGLEFPLDWGSPTIASAVMASAPQHKVIKKLLENVRNHWDQVEDKFNRSGDKDIHHLAVERSMGPLTESFLEEVSLEDNAIALPVTYFYPIKYFFLDDFHNNYFKRIQSSAFSYISKIFNIYSQDPISNWVYKRSKKCCVFYDVQPETFSYHDYFEQNSLMKFVSFRDGFGFYDKQFESYYDDISKKDKVLFKGLESLYNDNSPSGNLPFNEVSKIGSLVHFIAYDDVISDDYINSFKENNPGFKLVIWNNDLIESEFPGIISKSKIFSNDKERKFYLAINIITKYGGIYINHLYLRIRQTLYELNNKYDLYLGLLPIIPDSLRLRVDNNFIASKPNHNVLDEVLNKIEKYISKGKTLDISAALIAHLYERSKSTIDIALPPMYFHPLSSRSKEGIIQKVKRLYYGYNSAFASYNKNISIGINNYSR